MFRRERPQKGRYRQFFQIGAEAIGSDSPTVDAEVIELVDELLALGVRGSGLLVNSVGDPRIAGRLHRPPKSRLERTFRRSPTRSAAPSRIRCACSTAKFRRISRSSKCFPVFTSIWTTGLPRTFRRRLPLSRRPRDRLRSQPAPRPRLLTTTCGRLSKWCTARSARRIRCWAAAATTDWRNARFQSPGSGYRLLDRRRPAGDGRRGSARRPESLDPVHRSSGERRFRRG